jgi:FPC/CPF motif-containing protein YcgG
VININGLFKDDPSYRYQLQQWKRTALEKFEEKMKDKERPFPCIPATIGFSTNQLRYGFVGDPRASSTIDEVVVLLSEYTQRSKQFGKFTSLIVFYETPQDLIETYCVEKYEQLFWEHLNGLSRKDSQEWPNHIPDDPHNPIWEFCFNGEQYFIYCATPSHRNRQSRYFDYLLLAITPRWVLQEFNTSKIYAKNIKSQVRKRLKNYDSIDIHPDLNSYGENGNYEWRQYFLRDDDKTLSKCPFQRFLSKILE